MVALAFEGVTEVNQSEGLRPSPVKQENSAAALQGVDPDICGRLACPEGKANGASPELVCILTVQVLLSLQISNSSLSAGWGTAPTVQHWSA